MLRRVLLIAGGVVVGLVLLAVGAVFVLTNTDWGHERVRRIALSALSGAVHGHVKLGRVDGNLLKGVTLHDLSITDSAGAPFLAVDSLTTRFGLVKLVTSKRIDLNDVRLVRPVIVLDKQPGGPWNYERIFPSDTTKKADTAQNPWTRYLRFRDVELVQGRVTVRQPWSPPDSLPPAQRDSVATAALAGDGRAKIVRVVNGFQVVRDFRDLDARMPLIRMADPAHESRLVQVERLDMIMAIFLPPEADVRMLAGTFEFTSDSVWFRDVRLHLPATQATARGRYDFAAGTMHVEASTRPAALADLRFAYPRLPSEGTAALDVVVDWPDSATQRYLVRNADLRVGGATATGDLGLTLGDTLRLHDVNLQFANVDTKLVEQLVPNLDVPRSGVASGRFSGDGVLSALRVDADVTFDDREAGRNRVAAVGEVGMIPGGGVRARDLRLRLDPVQVALARMAMPDLPVGGTVAGTATVNGATTTQLAAVADLTHQDRGARSHLVGRTTMRFGDVPWFDVDLAARPLSLVTVGRFAPAVGLRGTATGPIRARGSLGDLAVNSQLRFSDGGQLSAVGRLDLASREKRYDLAVRTHLFNANAVVASAPVTELTARATARGRGFEPATMQATLSADVLASRYDTIAVDSARVRARVAGGLVTVDPLLVRGQGVALDAVGSFGLAAGRSGELTYRVAVDSLASLARYFPRDTTPVPPRPSRVAQAVARAREDSARVARETEVMRAATGAPPVRLVVDTPTTIRKDSLAGAVYAAGTVRGSLKDFDLRGRAGAENLVAMGNVVRRAKVEYAWTNGGQPHSNIAVALQADSAFAGGFALDSVDARATYGGALGKGGGTGTAQVAVFQDDAREYGLRADYVLNPRGNEVRFAQLRMRFDTTTWASTRPGALRWGGPGIEVANLELLNGAGGRIYVNGTIPTEGEADLQVAVNGFQVGDVASLLQSDLPMQGVISLDAQLRGTAAGPILHGTTAVTRGTFRGSPLPDLATTFDYANTELRARATLASPAPPSDTTQPRPLTVPAQVQTAAGSLPPTTATALVVRTVETRPPLASAEAVVPVNLAWKDVTGPRLPERPLRADITLDSLPVDLVSRFTDALADVRGRTVGAVAVRGTVKRPQAAGQVLLVDGSARVVPLGITMGDVTASIRLRGDTVVIDSLVGYSRGRVALAGGLGIKNPAQPSFDLRFVSQNARLLDNTQGRARVEAYVSMYGPFDDVYVSGGARVREGVFYIPPSDGKEVISSNDPALFNVVDTASSAAGELLPSQSPLLRNMRMNLSLAVDRDTWVRSQEANVEIYTDGDLRVAVNRRQESLAIEGVVLTDRGQYTFLSRRFDLRQGAVTFFGSSELNPMLQLVAEYNVQRGVQQPLTIRVVIGGTLRSPRISLESDARPPIPQSDLISFVAFGSESSSLLQFGSSSGSSTSGQSATGGLFGAGAAYASRQLTGVALGVLVNEVETEAARSLGADVFNITPADVPVEFWRPDFGNFLNTTQIEFGKYWTRQTFIGAQGVIAAKVPGLRLEHRFTRFPGLALESTFQQRFMLIEPSLAPQMPIQKSVFGVFLTRRWRF